MSYGYFMVRFSIQSSLHDQISDFPFDSQECGIPYATYYAISSELRVNGYYDAKYDFDSVVSLLSFSGLK